MAEKFFRVFGDQTVARTCRSCGRELLFYETLKAHYMPVHRDAKPVEKLEQEGQRPIWTFAGSSSHFTACDNPERFRKE
jgi:hypothetical protein